MPKLFSAVVFLVGLYLLQSATAQTLKVGFFAGGELLDGGYVQGAYTGLQNIIAKYGSRLQVGYQSAADVRLAWSSCSVTLLTFSGRT
jgi:hypothetical protein